MAHILIWTISAASIILMLFRPFKTPEVVWVSAGALLLCLLRLMSLVLAGKAVAEGLDVYLFLTGMMLLSELAKDYGVFEWMAHLAVKSANRSPTKTVYFHFCGRRSRDNLHVQRCHGGCSHASRARSR